MDSSSSGQVTVPDELVEGVQGLYDAGAYLQALALAEAHAPLRRWTGTRARVIAGRLAGNLGGTQLAQVHHYMAYRQDPESASARYYYSVLLSGRRGALAAWEFMARHPEPGEPRERAYWLARRARLAAQLRDFPAAEADIAAADSVAAAAGLDLPYLHCERSCVYEFSDRKEEALAAAERSLATRPWYRPGVQHRAHLLAETGRKEEAAGFLEAATEHIEAGSVMLQLLGFWHDMRRYDRVLAWVERVVERIPLAPPELHQWVESRRAHASYLTGDLAGAEAAARRAGAGPDKVLAKYWGEVAERLATRPAPPTRHELDIPFIRQNYRTCAPATLTSLARFWGVEADHLRVAEEICYDGTRPHTERTWAENQGFRVREFTVTMDSTRALIDAGIPFTLATLEPDSGHLQAVVGYDEVARSLLIRDPSRHYLRETVAEEFLEHYASSGPRGMALVPEAQAGALDAIPLPDQGLWDHYHRLQVALEGHRRGEAQAAADAIAAAAPGHRLDQVARLGLACYDANHPAQRAAYEALLVGHPKAAELQLGRIRAMHHLVPRHELRQALRAYARDPEVHPAILSRLARELTRDSRRHPEARRLLQRSIRRRGDNAEDIWSLAQLDWLGSERTRAEARHRFAACLEEKKEGFVASYAAILRLRGRPDEATEFLERRFEDLGEESSGPAFTLFEELEVLGRPGDALALLDRALARRPEDGDLWLFAARARARLHAPGAAEALEKARDKVAQVAYLQACAELEEARGDPAAARESWRQVLASEPFSLHAHAEVARLTDDLDGPAAATTAVREATRAHPSHAGLLRFLVERLREHEPEAALPELRCLLALCPSDAWAHRELALAHSEKGEHDEALAAAQEGRALATGDSASHSVLGAVRLRREEVPEAREAFREAIRRDAANTYAMQALTDLGGDGPSRDEDLAFLRAELDRQPNAADGIFTWRRCALSSSSPEEVLASLRQLRGRWPRSWEAHAAVIQSLLDMDQLDAALEAVEEFQVLFGNQAATWRVVAIVQRTRGDLTAARESLERGRTLAPWEPATVLALGDVLLRSGEVDRARELLAATASRTPRNPRIQAELARMCWRAGERDAALEAMERALEGDPGNQDHWDEYQDWSDATGAPDRPLELVRAAVEQRPGRLGSWLVLARLEVELEAQLVAYDRALALAPLDAGIHDEKARALAEAGRYDEALAACRPPAWPEPPRNLRGRAIWVGAQRGDRASARAEMLDLLAEDPDYFWGWTTLAQWAEEDDDAEAWRTATTRLVELAPRSPYARKELGRALLADGARDEAKAALRRAVELSPIGSDCGPALVRMELDDGDLGAARDVLALVAAFLSPEDRTALVLDLAAASKDLQETRARLDDFLATGPTSVELVLRAIRTLHESGFKMTILRALSRSVMAGEATGAMASAWAQEAMGIDFAKGEAEIQPLARSPEVWRTAAAALLNRFATDLSPGQVTNFLERHRTFLAGGTESWGAVGYALGAARLDKKVVAWFEGWREREDVRPWMLTNLVASLQILNRMPEATEVARQALDLPPDATTGQHHLWVAVGEALGGDPAEVGAHLAAARRYGEQRNYYRYLALVAEAAAAAVEDDIEWVRARRLLVEARALPEHDQGWVELRRIHDAAVRQIASRRTGMVARAWSLWHSGSI